MQMIARRKVRDYAEWREVFDDDAEQRRNAGLNMLQMWRDADDSTVVWMLYEVHDRNRASAYMDGLGKLHSGKGGVTEGSHYFVRTA